jgi:hypothetical protein
MADTIKQLTNEQKTILMEVSHLLLIIWYLTGCTVQLVLPIVTGQSLMDVMSEENNRLSCLENYRGKKTVSGSSSLLTTLASPLSFSYLLSDVVYYATRWHWEFFNDEITKSSGGSGSLTLERTISNELITIQKFREKVSDCQLVDSSDAFLIKWLVGKSSQSSFYMVT